MAGTMHSFGPFRFDAAQRMLFRGGDTVPLVPKAADTLLALLENRGRVVEKAELMKLVWPDTTVEEIGLARNISLLRKALGDDTEQYIQTIPRRGYRFVEESPEPAAVAAPAPQAQASTTRRRWIAAAVAAAVLGILVYWQFYLPSKYLPRGVDAAAMAVMPFQCLGGAPAELSQEFNEMVVAEISRQPSVQVISPSTVARYQGLGISPAIMGRVLRLDVILEGTIQRTAGGNRVTARLADVRSGKLVWADVFEVPGDAGQEAARAIAAQVGAHLAIRGRFGGR